MGILGFKKQIAVAVIALVLAVGVVGCGGNSGGAGTQSASPQSGSSAGASTVSATGSGSSATSKQPEQLVLEESGYTVLDSGYIMWGAIVRNPNTDWGALFPVINIVGKSADGKVLFADSQTLKDIYPGETIAYGFQAGNKDAAPDTVEFSVSVEDRKWVNTTETRDGLYTIENINAAASQYGMSSFTGEITLNAQNEKAQKPALTLFLRDAEGKIIYGNTTFQQTPLSVGVPTAFEISCLGVPEAYASVEVHATPWM